MLASSALKTLGWMLILCFAFTASLVSAIGAEYITAALLIFLVVICGKRIKANFDQAWP